MNLINQQTGQPEEVSYEDFGSKFLSGQYAIDNSEPVYLVDPDGGLDLYESASVADAVNKAGYKFPTTEQVNEFENKAKYGNRPFAAGALSAADAASFGMATRLGIGSGAISQETAENLPKYNPAASVIGTVGGIAGSLLLGPEAAILKTAGEALGIARATGNAVEVAKAAAEYKRIKGTLTALDAANPVKGLSKIGENVFEAIAAVPEKAGTVERLTRTGLGGAAQGALEGAAFTLGEINREDALGNPDLTASHVLSEVGWSAALGGGLGALVRGGLEGGKIATSKMFPRGTFADAVSDATTEQSAKMASSIDSTLAPTGPISMKSLDEIAQATKNMPKAEFADEALPTMKEAIDIANRLPIQLKPHAVQIESLRDHASRLKYSSFLDEGSEAAVNEQKLQMAQKRELEGVIDNTIKQISPNYTDDELLAGQKTAKKLDELFTDQKNVLGPEFDKFDKASSNLAKSPEEMLQNLDSRLKGVGGHIGVEMTEGGYKVIMRPYSDSLPYSRNVHQALGQLAKAINKEDLSIGEIRNVTRKLGAKLQKTSDSYGSDRGVIQQIKNVLSDYVADEIDRIDPSVGAKKLNRDYAILKDNEKTIKSMLGGSIEEGASYSKSIDPTKVIKNIFNPNDFNAVIEAKKILPTADFNEALASKISMMVRDATDQNTKIFSSKKFATTLNKHRLVLEEALKDNPAALRTIRDSATLMKILPDAGPVNVSRTAPVGFNMLKALVSPHEELKNAVFGIKEQLERKGKEAVINEMLSSPGTTFAQAEANVNRKWRAYNTLSKLNEIGEKSNKLIISKSKRAVEPLEDVVRRAPGIVASKIATREEKQKSYSEDVKKFNKSSRQINMMMANPSQMMKALDDSTKDIYSAAPKTAQSLQTSMIRAMMFLNSKMPKKQTDSLFPEPFVPSQAEAVRFAGYVKTVEDPYSVLDGLKDNKISPDQIEALASAHPQLYDAMRMEVMNQITSLKKMPSYQKRLSLSMFLGQDVDSSLNPQMVAANQASFATMKNGGSEQQAMQGVKPTSKGLSSLNLSDRSLLPMDKSANRRESKDK